VPENDATLVQKVRSEVLGSEPFAGHSIAVSAADGTVTLRGQLSDPAHISALEQRVDKVAGVRKVENLVHTPGSPAPNKQAARSAG
jgi:osmotically-inducible protein OsmY